MWRRPSGSGYNVNAAEQFGDSWTGFKQAFDSGRLAHAYIIAGSPRGQADTFARAVLHLLYGAVDADDPVARRLAEHAHPDVRWIKPMLKSRQIGIDIVRKLITLIQQSALEGTWKVGLIYDADRLTTQASNALLKTLEEPLGQAMLLLLTDAPQQLLPTIRSRCQQITLKADGYALTSDQMEAVLTILRAYRGNAPIEALLAADALGGLLQEIRDQIEADLKREDTESSKEFDARVSAAVREVRAEIMKVMLHWQRDILYFVLGQGETASLHFPAERDVLAAQAEGLPYNRALRRLAAVEEMDRRLQRNVNPRPVFEAAFIRQIAQRRRTATAH